MYFSQRFITISCPRALNNLTSKEFKTTSSQQWWIVRTCELMNGQLDLSSQAERIQAALNMERYSWTDSLCLNHSRPQCFQGATCLGPHFPWCFQWFCRGSRPVIHAKWWFSAGKPAIIRPNHRSFVGKSWLSQQFLLDTTVTPQQCWHRAVTKWISWFSVVASLASLEGWNGESSLPVSCSCSICSCWSLGDPARTANESSIDWLLLVGAPCYLARNHD